MTGIDGWVNRFLLFRPSLGPHTRHEEEEEIKPYVHSAILTYEDKSMFMFSPNGPA